MSQARKKRVKRSDPVQRLQRTVKQLKGKNECLGEKVKTLEEEIAVRGQAHMQKRRLTRATDQKKGSDQLCCYQQLRVLGR